MTTLHAPGVFEQTVHELLARHGAPPATVTVAGKPRRLNASYNVRAHRVSAAPDLLRCPPEVQQGAAAHEIAHASAPTSRSRIILWAIVAAIVVCGPAAVGLALWLGNLGMAPLLALLFEAPWMMLNGALSRPHESAADLRAVRMIGAEPVLAFLNALRAREQRTAVERIGLWVFRTCRWNTHPATADRIAAVQATAGS